MLRVNVIKERLKLIAANLSVGKKDSPVLLLGNSGAGKSTLGNYLLGYSMKVDCEGNAISVEKPVPMEMGSGISSVTFMPQVHRGVDGSLYCDCPGFNDNRDPETNLCASISTEMVVSAAKSIGAIIFVVDYNSVTRSKGQYFLELIGAFCNIFQHPEQNLKSAIIVFTKVHSRFSKKIILNQLVEFEKFINNKIIALKDVIEKGNNSLGDGKELHERLSLLVSQKIFLHTVIANQGNVHIGDVFDKGQSRVNIISNIKKNSAIDARDLNLRNNGSTMGEFNNIINKMLEEYGSLHHECKIIPAQIKSTDERIKLLRNAIANKDKLISWFYSKKSELIQNRVILNECDRQLQYVNKLLDLKINSHKSMQSKLLDWQDKLDYLKANTPELYWQKQHEFNPGIATRHRDKISFIMQLIGVEAELSDLASESIAAILEGDSEPVFFLYDDLPIAHIEKIARGGWFSSEHINKADGVLSLTYSATKGEEQFADVKIFVKRNLIPENIRNSNYITKEIGVLKQQILDTKLNVTKLGAEKKDLEKIIATIKDDSTELDVNLPKSLQKECDQLEQQITILEENKLTLENKNKHTLNILKSKKTLYNVVVAVANYYTLDSKSLLVVEQEKKGQVSDKEAKEDLELNDTQSEPTFSSSKITLHQVLNFIATSTEKEKQSILDAVHSTRKKIKITLTWDKTKETENNIKRNIERELHALHKKNPDKDHANV